MSESFVAQPPGVQTSFELWSEEVEALDPNYRDAHARFIEPEAAAYTFGGGKAAGGTTFKQKINPYDSNELSLKA